MILPPGHAQQIRKPYPFRKREKAMIGGVLATLAVIVVVLVISVATADKKSGHGCISVSLGYSIGGNTFNACGQKARDFCAGAHRQGLTGAAGQVVARECRKAGLAVG
jgi:uncharacterized membrane protein